MSTSAHVVTVRRGTWARSPTPVRACARGVGAIAIGMTMTVDRIRSNSMRRLYQGLTDDQRIKLSAALEQVRIIEGAQPHCAGTDRRFEGWFLQRTPSTGTPIGLLLVKRDAQDNRVTQTIQVWPRGHK